MSDQVCQKHGLDDDLVVCPYVRCQAGRVPQWWGTGMPAGVRECTSCDGRGRIPRSDAREAALRLPVDARHSPPCICWALRHG